MSWQTGAEQTPVAANLQAQCKFSRPTQEPVSNLSLMIQDTLSDTCQWFLLKKILKQLPYRFLIMLFFIYFSLHLKWLQQEISCSLSPFFLRLAFLLLPFCFSGPHFTLCCRFVSQSQREIDPESCWECIVVTKEVVSQATVTTWNLTEFLPLCLYRVCCFAGGSVWAA